MELETGTAHRLIIDRFEGDLAVVEVDGARFLTIPRWFLPADAREDDVVSLTTYATPDGTLTHQLRIDHAATTRAREETTALVDRLRRKDPGGDLSL